MLKEVTNITITQNSEGRSKKLFFDFCNSWSFESNWEDLSATGKIIFPKNIIVVDETSNTKFPLFGTNKNINDLFRKGDKVKVETKYIYWDKNLGQKNTDVITIFNGFITNVKAGIPIEVSIEDNFYQLKQIPMLNQSFSSNISIEEILKNALSGTDFTVRMLTTITLQIDNALLTAENETIAQFLQKLKKDYFLKCYFKGNELRIGSFVYIEKEAFTGIFEFQNNIISSNLVYSRTDDIVLSAVASNHIKTIFKLLLSLVSFSL